jgi:hypothetical protein
MAIFRGFIHLRFIAAKLPFTPLRRAAERGPEKLYTSLLRVILPLEASLRLLFAWVVYQIWLAQDIEALLVIL